MKALAEKIRNFDTWRLYRKVNKMNINAKLNMVFVCMYDKSSVISFSLASIWLYSILITKKCSLPEWEKARVEVGRYQGFSRVNCWNTELTCYSVNNLCKAIADGVSPVNAAELYNEMLISELRCFSNCSYCVAKLGKIDRDNPKCPDYSIFLDHDYPIYNTGKIVSQTFYTMGKIISFPLKVLFFTVALPIYFLILLTKRIVILLKKKLVNI